MFSVLERSELVSRSRHIALGIPAVALLFLPFATFEGNLSPWGAVCKGWTAHDEWSFADRFLAVFCAPFFLSIPILIAQARLFLKGQFSNAERSLYRRLAYAALLLGMIFPVGMAIGGLFGGIYGIYFQILMPAIPYVAGWILILNARKLNAEEAVMVTLRTAWLPNAIYCAIGALVTGHAWEIGAYLAAFTIVVYTVEITRSMNGGEAFS